MSKTSMKLVGQRTKLKVLGAVSGGGISAQDISKKTGILPSTVRLHLLKAKKSRLITAEKKGRSVLYAPAANKTAQAAFVKMGLVPPPQPADA